MVFLIVHIIKNKNRRVEKFMNVTIKALIEMINTGIIELDLAGFEPTDTEGCVMEGTVDYYGKHCISLYRFDGKSYEEQAALQILHDLKAGT